MYTIKCKNCGQANKITNIRCEFCNVELNHDAISKAREKVIKSRDKKAKNISDIIIALIFLPCSFSWTSSCGKCHLSYYF